MLDFSLPSISQISHGELSSLPTLHAIMTSGARSDSSSVPNIRNACEECHNRKIRCGIPTEGGPCQNCHNNGRLCFFLPRNKSGRSKYNQTGGGSQAKSSANAAAISSAVAAAIAKSQTIRSDSESESFLIGLQSLSSERSHTATPTPIFTDWLSQQQQQQQQPNQHSTVEWAPFGTSTDCFDTGFIDCFHGVNNSTTSVDMDIVDMCMNFSPANFCQPGSDAENVNSCLDKVSCLHECTVRNPACPVRNCSIRMLVAPALGFQHHNHSQTLQPQFPALPTRRATVTQCLLTLIRISSV